MKIIFLDFDKTLYSHDTNCVPASAVEALNNAHNKGIKIFICTGRSLFEMDSFDLSMLHLDGLIANNGQLAYDSNNKIIFDYPVTGKLKELIIEKFNAKINPMIIFTENDSFCNYRNNALIDMHKNIHSPLPPIKKYNGEKFYMASGFFNDDKKIDDLMPLQEHATITFWNNEGIDVVPKGTSKAIGVKRILEYYDIDQKDSMGIGDGENDIEMIKYCGIGVAMGNSEQKIKDIADYVCSDIDKDGIYNTLKHYQII